MNPLLQKEQELFRDKFPHETDCDNGWCEKPCNCGIEKMESFLAESNQRMYEAGVKETIGRIIPQHNARILNEFQAQGKPDMPMIAYDVNVCLVPAIIKATKDTVESELLSLIKDK